MRGQRRRERDRAGAPLEGEAGPGPGKGACLEPGSTASPRALQGPPASGTPADKGLPREAPRLANTALVPFLGDRCLVTVARRTLKRSIPPAARICRVLLTNELHARLYCLSLPLASVLPESGALFTASRQGLEQPLAECTCSVSMCLSK